MDVCKGAPLSRTRAVVTGAGGQDGSYLVDLLLDRGYEVTGLVRDASREYSNLDTARDKVQLVQADLLDSESLIRILDDHDTREVYNLASPSFVPHSWVRPVETAEFAAVGVTALLEAIRTVDRSIRLYQASSSEIFGEPAQTPQSEITPCRPRTPYGAAKAYGNFIVDAYRRRYGLHASCGILYNHESPRRHVDFLPSKVAYGVAAIAAGGQSELVLGDLEARRDWGYAPDYVEAMWLMLQQDEPGDYVIATGELHTVQELVALAFAHAGLDWREHVRVDESLRRGQDYQLVGDASKARERLDWKPSVTFEQLVALLVDAARSAVVS